MKRPASVTVFGILNIVFAGFGFFGLLASIAVFAAQAGSNNPTVEAMRANPGYATWLKLTIPLGVLSTTALLASGIGMLFLKPWARLLALGYAIYAIVMSLVGIAINFIYVARPALEAAKGQTGPESSIAMGMAVGTIAGGCFGILYPVLLLIFMLRPKVVAAFQQVTQPPPPPT